jgi:GTP diphosphokinase / guanosine-3',5'-bis(diphosphate) 3'-diphosphatase
MRIETFMDRLPDIYTPTDRELILRAYKVAEKAHDGQTRASGEPYVSHCVAVADILVEKFLPAPYVLVAGLLHDTVEDTDITLERIRTDFGEIVAKLVDGVTKLTDLPRVSRIERQQDVLKVDGGLRKMPDQTRLYSELDEETIPLSRSRRYDAKSETLRKTLLAMAEQPEVVMIKLADRLHNMRTLNYVPENKRRRVAQETLDIFAPLANRLGIWQMKWELEDIAFRYTNSDKYKEIARAIADRRETREREMVAITQKVKQVLADEGIDSEISGRPKHIYSIYRKMVRKSVPFEALSDIRGVRVLVHTNQDCYSALGIIHSKWRPIPGEFDDYIAVPKDNHYRSLHTAVLYDDGKTVELQIRTFDMHNEAEQGIASHWRYKEGKTADLKFDEKILQFRSLMEWRQDVQDATEFVDGMKTDVFADRVYVFTPRGDAIDLPSGATPIDFAYQIHTEIGNRCRGAKVNGKLVPLDYTLKTGDRVEILTVKRGGPSRDWLNPDLGLVKTQRAKSKIRHWFKVQAREQNIAQGKLQIERELRRLGVVDFDFVKLATDMGFRNVDDFFFVLGCGDLPMGRVINYLTLPEREKESDDFQEYISDSLAKPIDKDAVSVKGLKGLLTIMARCCRPAPGDEIIGYITRGRGVTIHRQDCPNILKVQDRDRLVRTSWGEASATFPVPVQIRAYDRMGLMREVSTIFEKEGVNMTKVEVKVHQNIAVFDLTIEVRNVNQLSKVLTRIENLENVLKAERVRGG